MIVECCECAIMWCNDLDIYLLSKFIGKIQFIVVAIITNDSFRHKGLYDQYSGKKDSYLYQHQLTTCVYTGCLRKKQPLKAPSFL